MQHVLILLVVDRVRAYHGCNGVVDLLEGALDARTLAIDRFASTLHKLFQCGHVREDVQFAIAVLLCLVQERFEISWHIVLSVDPLFPLQHARAHVCEVLLVQKKLLL